MRRGEPGRAGTKQQPNAREPAVAVPHRGRRLPRNVFSAGGRLVASGECDYGADQDDRDGQVKGDFDRDLHRLAPPFGDTGRQAPPRLSDRTHRRLCRRLPVCSAFRSAGRRIPRSWRSGNRYMARSGRPLHGSWTQYAVAELLDCRRHFYFRVSRRLPAKKSAASVKSAAIQNAGNAKAS